MASSPSPSASLDDRGVVISTRCSFETVEAFHASERQLRSQQYEADARDIRRHPTKFHRPSFEANAAPPFVSAVKSPSQFTLKTEAARRNDHAKTPYKPPSDFAHRIASPPATWRCPSDDFVAKFRLPSNQDLRSRVALDQEGFFSDVGRTDRNRSISATHLIASDHSDAHPPRSPSPSVSMPDFQTSVPHTTRKSANVKLRIETIVDQDGLLPNLSEIRRHQFRDETSPSCSRPLSSTGLSTEPFRTTFKPAPSLRPIGGGNI